MATTSRRISRKELRQPDWFQSVTEQAVEFYYRQRVTVYLGLAAVVLVFLGIWGWEFFKDRQDSMAAQEFGQAMTLYHAEKYTEAVPILKDVETYRWSNYGNLAYLYEANSYLALNDFPKATNAIQRFIAGTDTNSLMRQIGLLTLADIEERQSQCAQAIKNYSDAGKIKAALTERALLGEARCAVQTGDLQRGLAAYRQLIKDEPESRLASYVRFQISELESKLATAQPTPK
ncbi:MAG TPA: tetratricopeptide repeat protein [Candidatus Binatia bacterium]|jgi:predicted negative regulator of RcsB-dependent stress response